MPAKILKIAVPTPLYKIFDYLAPDDAPESIAAGSRALISFGRQQLIGIVLSQQNVSELPLNKLKPVTKLLPQPLPEELVELMQWAARYYHHPVGEALQQALPVLLRQQEDSNHKIHYWQLTDEGLSIEPSSITRAPRQAQLLQRLQQAAQGQHGLDKDQLNQLDFNWRDAMRALEKKGWVQQLTDSSLIKTTRADTTKESGPLLNAQQADCVEQAIAALGHYQPLLLQGITGSGKTEVYLRLVEEVLKRDEQSLILVPEINLTPQLIRRFEQRFDAPIAVLHSGLNNTERLLSWQRARDHQVLIIIGTRSALFTPLAKPGLIIIDEEHDNSYKQQEGFRYHARDLALVRARNLNIPVLMGSATPSLESLYNCQQNRYKRLRLDQRAGNARPPNLQLLDVRRRPMQEGLSDHFIALMREHLAQKSQVLLFLNRRGFAPTLLCHDCGWVMPCPRCDARLTLHQQKNLMRCHHCGHETRPPVKCPECQGEELIHIGIGTERLEQHLTQLFPEHTISRIDSDTTRRKGTLDDKLAEAHRGDADILIGTQMLAKGHDFPLVTLVGVLDVDSSLFSSDFRAPEFMAQQLIQVAGRAGRAERPGQVVIQTHHPDHPLLQILLQHGYETFAESALEERQMAEFPPYSSLAILRAEATRQDLPPHFLQQVVQFLQGHNTQVELFGPLPSPMERRAGRYRYQLLFQSHERGPLQTLLNNLIPRLSELPGANKVRWSIDVDPQSML